MIKQLFILRSAACQNAWVPCEWNAKLLEYHTEKVPPSAISVTVIKKPYLTSKNIEYTVTFTTWLSMYYLLSVNNDTRTCLSDDTDMFIDINICF